MSKMESADRVETGKDKISDAILDNVGYFNPFTLHQLRISNSSTLVSRGSSKYSSNSDLNCGLPVKSDM